MTSGLASRIDRVRERIASAGRDPEDVTLIAVTKGFGAATAREALAHGLVDLGESYVQEMVAKVEELAQDAGTVAARPRWHFVGRLQRNKVRRAAAHVAVWHSVDRLRLGAEIARHQPGATVLVQVNATGEAAKAGCRPGELAELLDGLRSLDLDVCGLMTIGPQGPPEHARPAFTELSRLADRFGLAERSMGMSNDLEIALQEGATMVRIGSALFGPRPGDGGVGD